MTTPAPSLASRADLYAVMLAGGGGERFWPASTAETPKQFLSLGGGPSLIQQAFERAASLAPPERILVVGGRRLGEPIRAHLPDLPPANLLLEPVARDTAAAIGLAAVHLARRRPGTTMVVLPADHHIAPLDGFAATIADALAALEGEDALVTIGIEPARPETGYGYLLAGERRPGSAARRVARFTEKPDRRTAEGFLRDGRYFWNGGIFVWRTATIAAEFARSLPRHWDRLRAIGEALGGPDEAGVLEREFAALEPISVDYGILEQAANVCMVPARFQWSDVGSWPALAEIWPADADGNVVRGAHAGLDTAGCIIVSDGRPVGTVGLRDLVVVATARGVLVCPRDRAQEVKALVQQHGLSGERGAP
jgi:mannose-1-phosphate guanylyltransferase